MSYKSPYNAEQLYKVRTITTIKELINSSAALHGENPAFLIKEEKGGPYKEITYKKFKEDVDALGTKIIDLGLGNVPIAVIGENSYQWVVAYCAIVNGAGFVVPLDKELGIQEIHNLIKTAGCKAVFYSSIYQSLIDECEIDFKFRMEFYYTDETENQVNSWMSLLRSGRKLVEEGDRRFLDIDIDPEEMKALLFTSGTADVAKGVMICQKNIVANVMSTCKIFDIKESDRTLSVLPIHHTFESTIGIMVVLFYGASVAFSEGLKYVLKNMNEARCSILVAVPLIFESMYSKIWKQAEKANKTKALKTAIGLHKTLMRIGIDKRKIIFKSVYNTFGGKLRLFISGAASINLNVFRGFHDLGFEIAQGYGLTEAAPLIAGMPYFSDRYKKAGSVGPVIPDGELDIIDKNDLGIGEIIYRGPNVMMGYYKLPEKTEEALKDGWLYTGDLGYVDDEGWLYITGRKKNVIVTKTGKNIYPEELEQYLSGIKYIKESLVYGKDSDESVSEGTIVSAQIRPEYEVIREEYGKDFSVEQIYALIRKEIAELNRKIPSYKRIRHISIRLEDFIKTTTQKIKRKESLLQ